MEFSRTMRRRVRSRKPSRRVLPKEDGLADKDQPETVCDHCGGAGAVVHLTQVVNNETKTSHLCQRCAAEKGLQPNVPFPNILLADFLAKMGGDEFPPGGPREDLTCPFCGLSAADFREVGRLGCPQCYPTFETSPPGPPATDPRRNPACGEGLSPP